MFFSGAFSYGAAYPPALLLPMHSVGRLHMMFDCLVAVEGMMLYDVVSSSTAHFGLTGLTVKTIPTMATTFSCLLNVNALGLGVVYYILLF